MTSPDFLERKQRELRHQTQGGRHEMRYCRHDRRMVEAIGPSRSWRWIAPTIGVVGFAIVIAAVFVDPIGFVALFAALLYIATLGPAIALARQVPKCAFCGREVPYHNQDEADAADRYDAARASPGAVGPGETAARP